MRHAIFVITTILTLFPAGQTRQVTAQDERDYRVVHFFVDDGLPQELVTGIQEDSLGFIWVGTATGGLCRYDGYTFHTFRPDGDSTSIGGLQINATHIDSKGNIWAGGGTITPLGVSRYDPETETFRRHKHDPMDPASLMSNQVVSIVSSPKQPNIVWFGINNNDVSSSGVSRLDVNTGVFTHYKEESGLGDYQVETMYIDREGTLWTVGMGGGLGRFDADEDKFYTLYPEAVVTNWIGAALHEDKEGILWMGSQAGLSRFDREKESFTSYLPAPGKARDPSNRISVILEDSHGTLWVGTGTGLFIFDRQKEQFIKTSYIDRGTIRALYEDSSGLLWVGANSGLSRLEPWTHSFKTYGHLLSSQHDVQLGPLRLGPFELDHKGAAWYFNQGQLFLFDPTTGAVNRHVHSELDQFFTSARINVSIDSKGIIWAGQQGKFARINPEQPEDIELFSHDPMDPHSLPNGYVNKVLEDQAGRIWVPFWGGGLALFDQEAKTFKQYNAASHGLLNDKVLKLYEASSEQGIIWVGHELGLSRFDIEEERFTNYDDERLVRSMMIHQDREGQLWVATSGNGFHLFDVLQGTIARSFTTENGLANNYVISIYEDDQGILWLGTYNGLSRFDPQKNSFTNYYERDGLPTDQFIEAFHARAEQGELWMGNFSELVSFSPSDIVVPSAHPKTVITRFIVNDENSKIGSGFPLQKSVMLSEEITINYNQNNIAFEYVGLHYTAPSQTLYRYKLDGYDDHWVDAGTFRSIRYTNLPHDEYVFRVESKNGNSEWNQASVILTILPPWWRTTFAFVVYGLLFVAGVIGVDRFQRRRLIARERLRAEREKAKAIESTNTELERALKHLTETQDQLIHTEKMASLGQLTAGVAHEIKNPLNFVTNFAKLSIGLTQEVQGVLERYQGTLETADAHELKSLLDDLKLNATKINEHGHRADGIIRSMLEHSRANPGEMRPVDINQLLDEYVNLSYHAVRAKTEGDEVTITRSYADDLPEIPVVPQEIGRVFINLLDNAFYAINEKQSSHGSRIKSGTTDGVAPSHYQPEVKVSTSMNNNGVEIKIADNGTGIPKDILSKIFEPFFTTKPTGSGTGLGLSLSYDIVTQGHGGSLLVESEEGRGSTFTIYLPL